MSLYAKRTYPKYNLVPIYYFTIDLDSGPQILHKEDTIHWQDHIHTFSFLRYYLTGSFFSLFSFLQILKRF